MFNKIRGNISFNGNEHTLQMFSHIRLGQQTLWYMVQVSRCSWASINKTRGKDSKRSIPKKTLIRFLIIISASRAEKGKQVFHAEPHVLDLVTAQGCCGQRTLLFLQLESRNPD